MLIGNAILVLLAALLTSESSSLAQRAPATAAQAPAPTTPGSKVVPASRGVAAPASAPSTKAAADAAPAPAPKFPEIERAVRAAIAGKKLPGCVVTVGRRQGVLYQKAFGMRELVPEREPMTADTIFDLASLTKPIATATALMVLVDRHRLDLDAPVRRYVAGFGEGDKREISVRDLLIHVSGLPAESPFDDYEHGRGEALKRIAALKLLARPGERFIYSDTGFMVLEEVVRKASGADFAAFTREAIFAPLGMRETGFLPSPKLRPRIAPTEFREEVWIRGEVHDPRAWRLGGVAGHAGLFSTARDLARYARMLLDNGSLDGVKVLSPEAVAQMVAPHDVPGGIRALGWDVQSRYSMNRGTRLSRRAFGHGGYTGTTLWLDPEQDLFVIFLSNRVHPDAKGSVNQLAGDIANSVSAQLAPAPALGQSPAPAPKSEPTPPLQLGIDVLAAENFARLRGARVAVLTNDTAQSADGTRSLDALASAPGVTLAAVFSPEHGQAANKDEAIPDGVDARWGVPVYSLYGKQTKPNVELLRSVDAVVVDLPDAGVRFYTYASTLHAMLRAAARAGVRFLVLDRPNPIDGVTVSGPMLDRRETSFVNHHPLPMRHGMTLGELAELINADEHLGAKLEVVRLSGYRRSAYYDETGLLWRPPSPNLRSVEQVVLYPAVALVEGTNVSVGRGTDRPFEQMGAPWIDADALLASMQSFGLAGVTFGAARFTPSSSVHAGKACQGLSFKVTDRAAFEPVRTGIALALALRKLHKSEWQTARFHEIIGAPAVTKAILAERPLTEIEALWKDELAAFQSKRQKYLLYP